MTSDLITPKLCDSIHCFLRFSVGNPISLRNGAFHWLTYGFMLLIALPCCAKECNLKGGNVKKCIERG